MVLFCYYCPMNSTLADKQREHAQHRAWLSFLGAAFLFAFSSVCIKLNSNFFQIGAMPALMSRFFLGFVLMLGWSLARREDLRAKRKDLVIGRGILNLLAVFLFFLSITLTTVTKANLLNQLFPAFIILVSPLINRERTKPWDLVWLGLTLLGTVLVMVPPEGLTGFLESGNFLGDMIGLLGAVASALAVSVLREARKADSTATVIVWQFGTGSLVLLVALPFFWISPPSPTSWFLLIATGLAGFGGQVLATWGYRYLAAATGGMILNTGVLFAALAGVILFGEIPSLALLLGSILIAIALLGLSGYKPSGHNKARGT